MSDADHGAELSSEDAKLVTLARGARARASAAEGAAVLDDMGRSYAAAAVDLPGLQLTAVQAAVAAAVSSGSRRLDRVVVVASSRTASTGERALLDEIGGPRVLAVGLDGHLLRPEAAP